MWMSLSERAASSRQKSMWSRAVLVPREPADDVGAELDALLHQPVRAGLAQDPLLRERHHLEVRLALEPAPELEQSRDRHGTADRVDVGEGAHGGGPVDDPLVDDRGGAVGDLIGRVAALVIPRDVDRLLQRLRLVRPHRVAEHALVEVHVAVDEPG
jgi:hypothetical protein